MLEQAVDAKLDHPAGYAYAQHALPELEKVRTSLNALAQDTQARVAADRDEARRVGTRHSNDRLAGMQQALRMAEVVATLRLAPSAWPSR